MKENKRLMAPLGLDLCCKIILPISNLSHQSNVSWAVMHGSQGRSLAMAIGSCQNWTRNIMNQANGKDKEATDTVPRVWDLSGENWKIKTGTPFYGILDWFHSDTHMTIKCEFLYKLMITWLNPRTRNSNSLFSAIYTYYYSQCCHNIMMLCSDTILPSLVPGDVSSPASSVWLTLVQAARAMHASSLPSAHHAQTPAGVTTGPG